MKLHNIIILVLSLILLTSCENITIGLYVKKDGTVIRKLILKRQGKVNKKYKLPKSREWTTLHEKKNENEVEKSIKRIFKLGHETPSDLIVLDKENEMCISNEYTIKYLSEGIYRYNEAIRWHGKRNQIDLGFYLPDTSNLFTKASKTEEDEKVFKKCLQETMYLTMHGPPKGFISILIGFENEELARYKFIEILIKNLCKSLKSKFKSKLTNAELDKTCKNTEQVFLDKYIPEPDFFSDKYSLINLNKKEKDKENDKNRLDSIDLTYIFKTDFEVIYTNGIIESNNVIKWHFNSGSVELSDVNIEVIFRKNKE